jgi:hypothetical protein
MSALIGSGVMRPLKTGLSNTIGNADWLGSVNIQ